MKQEEKLEEAKRLYKDANADQRYVLESLFPELAEIEDVRIRKEIIAYLKADWAKGEGITRPDWIAWLEEQSKQSNNNEDADILQRFSFYSYKDEPNVLYLSNVFVNEEYRNKGIGTKILKIADEIATSMKCSSILLKTEIGSNAEKLYKNNGYSVFRRERNQVWLKKQCEKKPVNKVEPKFKSSEISGGEFNGRVRNPTAEAVDEWVILATEEEILHEPKFKAGDWIILATEEEILHEPKFKAGDWIIHQGTENIYQVVAVIDNQYQLKYGDTYTIQKCVDVDSHTRLWTIQDAKDGDVLTFINRTIVTIFKENNFNPEDNSSYIFVHCGMINGIGYWHEYKWREYGSINLANYVPATKEQRDLLFQKMKQAGYEWDNKKKELKKIKNSY